MQDAQWKCSYAVIEVPAVKKEFKSGKYTADTISSSIGLQYKAADSFSSEYKTKKTFKAAEMKKNIQEAGDTYCISYKLKYSYGKGKYFPCSITITAPNGYADSVYSSSYGLWIYRKYTSEYTMGSSYFKDLLTLYDEIPTGKYTVRLYL